MSRILILTQFFPPETNAGAHRLKAMANVLSKQYEVSIIAPNPGYPSSELYDHVDVDELDKKFPGRVIRIATFHPHNQSLILRAIREIGMALKLTQKSFSIDAGIVIASSPSMFLIPFSWALARLRGAKFICDLRDLTWLYARETTKPSKLNTIVSIMLEKIMVSYLRSSHLVICATPGIYNVLVNEYKLQKDKIITIMNGVSDYTLILSKEIEDVIVPDVPTVTYIGLFGHNQGISILIDVAKQLPDVGFLLIGDGPEKEKILERTRQEGIGNLRIIEYSTDLEELARYYRQSSILFIHIKDAPVINKTAIPSKIFEYMAFGKPIIYAGNGIAVDFLNEIGCAITVHPGDIKAIVEAILKLRNNIDLMESMGKKGRDFIEKKFRREKLMEQLLTIVDTHL